MRSTGGARSIPGMWRWRRNPLRRRSDLVEAWVGLVTVTMAAVGAPAAGFAAGQAVDATLRRAVTTERAERHQVAATVLADRPRTNLADPDDTSGEATNPTATVSWRAPDGSRHRTTVSVVGHRSPGTILRVWTDRHGKLVPPPMDTTTATTNAVASGIGAAITTTAFLLAARRLLSWRILRRRLADWEREWSRISQDWGRAGAGG